MVLLKTKVPHILVIIYSTSTRARFGTMVKVTLLPVMKISPVAIYNWYRQTLRNPLYRWWVIIGTIVYLISPIDLSVDFAPIVGQIDDFILVGLLTTELSSIALESFKNRLTVKNRSQDESDGETIDVQATAVD